MLFQWLQRSYSLPGTPKQIFLEFHGILWNFVDFHEIFIKILKYYPNSGFAGSLECQALQPLLFPKEYQGFVKGCGWLKTQKTWISFKIMKLPEIPWTFINSYDFLAFHQFSALRRWHAKRTVIPMGFQWLQRAHSSPGTPKSDFVMKIFNSDQNNGGFMKFGEI